MNMVDENVLYLCPRAPTLKIKIGNETFQASKGVLTLTKREAAQLDALMVNRSDIKHMLKKVDMAAAIKQVEAHKAAQNPAAVKGPFGSTNSAASVMRQANQNQQVQNLTGKENPNPASAAPAKPAAPLDVKEIKTDPNIAGSVLNKIVPPA